jgi:hypothetical protein
MKSEIKFMSGGVEGIEVLCLSKEGVWVNPNVPVDEATRYVLKALGSHVKRLIDEAIKAEREACAKACEWEAAKLEQWPQRDVLTVRACAAAIRARGET